MIPNFELPALVEDLSLAYRLRAAKGAAEGLIVLLHGVGSNEASLAGLAALLPENLAVALVRSPLAMGRGAFCAFPVNFTSEGPVIDAHVAESSRKKLLCFIDELQARTNIAPARTLLAGFSQGGIMSASLALTSPATVAGFAILSGRILPEIDPLLASPEALAKLEVLILHGEQDNTLPVAWARRSVELLTGLGVRFTAKFYPDARKASSKRSGCVATFRQSRRVWSGMDSADAMGALPLVVNQVLLAAQCIAG